MSKSSGTEFVAPHPGSQQMPRWDTGELIDAPYFKWRNLLAMIGPGLVMGAAAIGGGEWLAGPQVTARYGPSLLWVATISILVQVLYNIEISRYTLYTGEPIFTGKFRIFPGPMFWLVIYLLLDWGSLAPYLATSAASPLLGLFRGEVTDPNNPRDIQIVAIIATFIYAACAIPLIFGGKVYNSLKVLMSFKLFVVIGFLLFVGLFYSYPATWWEIATGFVKFGNVPVTRGEDVNGNGILDPGEDFDGDGHLDVAEMLPKTVDTNKDGKADAWEKDAAGKEIRFQDVDGDGKPDGNNVDNAFLHFYRTGKWPQIDWSLIAVIAGLAAIAGNGGLTNTPISNFTRDQGWGMGHLVGAIPSVVGGQGITLSHVGCVFQVTEETLPRWRRWYLHVVRDQTLAWMLACFIGMGLPAILSVGFLPRGTECKDPYNTASLTAKGVEERTANPPSDILAARVGLTSILSGPKVGRFFWGCTLFCGFLVLITSMASTMDGFIRRWVDVIWTASPKLRELDTSYIGKLYFYLLVGYLIIGLSIIWLGAIWPKINPEGIFKAATTGYNFALAISAWHTLAINTTLLPKELRPNWFIRIGLVLGGCYFVLLGIMSVLKFVGAI